VSKSTVQPLVCRRKESPCSHFSCFILCLLSIKVVSFMV